MGRLKLKPATCTEKIRARHRERRFKPWPAAATEQDKGEEAEEGEEGKEKPEEEEDQRGLFMRIFTIIDLSMYQCM